MIRRRRKYRKKLGSRSYHGDKKNRRGKGIKGGRGRAGSFKHKKVSFLHEIGAKKGFKGKKGKPTPVNVGELNDTERWEKEGVYREGVYDFSGRNVKILGKGEIKVKINKVIAPEFSKRAEEKIRNVGGEVVVS